MRAQIRLAADGKRPKSVAKRSKAVADDRVFYAFGQPSTAGLDVDRGGRQSPSPYVPGLAPPIDGGLELALVHLRAALDSETLSLAVKLLLRALCSLCHE